MQGHYSDIWQALAETAGDRTAIITGDDRMDYARLARDAAGLAEYLRSHGLVAGDAVAIFLHNRAEFLVTLFACLATGIAPVPINFRYRSAEVSALLADSGARALVYPRSLSAVVDDALQTLGDEPALIVVDDGETGAPIENGARPATAFTDAVALPGILPPTPPRGGHLRLYTGGTTGRPRAVVWGADDILDVQSHSIYTVSGREEPSSMAQAIAMATDPEAPRVITLPLAPFMHGTALFTSMNTLALGGTIVIPGTARLDADEAIALCREHAVTRLVVAGDAVAIPLADAAERHSPGGLGSVTSAISSGMRLSDATKARLHALAPLTITDLLAATEGGPFAVGVTRSASDLPTRFTLLPGAVVLDDEGRDVRHTVGARGVLGFRGPLPLGYWRDPEKTAATFRVLDGVRHVIPGDWVLVKEDDEIELLGRGSTVINTGGEKVYPNEVEEALLGLPGVRDVLVLGVPDERFGEIVSAVIVADADGPTDAEIRDHLDSRLAGYKRPRHVIRRPSLDRSPHGKVDIGFWRATILDEIQPAGSA